MIFFSFSSIKKFKFTVTEEDQIYNTINTYLPFISLSIPDPSLISNSQENIASSRRSSSIINENQNINLSATNNNDKNNQITKNKNNNKSNATRVKSLGNTSYYDNELNGEELDIFDQNSNSRYRLKHISLLGVNGDNHLKRNQNKNKNKCDSSSSNLSDQKSISTQNSKKKKNLNQINNHHDRRIYNSQLKLPLRLSNSLGISQQNSSRAKSKSQDYGSDHQKILEIFYRQKSSLQLSNNQKKKEEEKTKSRNQHSSRSLSPTNNELDNPENFSKCNFGSKSLISSSNSSLGSTSDLEFSNENLVNNDKKASKKTSIDLGSRSKTLSRDNFTKLFLSTHSEKNKKFNTNLSLSSEKLVSQAYQVVEKLNDLKFKSIISERPNHHYHHQSLKKSESSPLQLNNNQNCQDHFKENLINLRSPGKTSIGVVTEKQSIQSRLSPISVEQPVSSAEDQTTNTQNNLQSKKSLTKNKKNYLKILRRQTSYDFNPGHTSETFANFNDSVSQRYPPAIDLLASENNNKTETTTEEQKTTIESIKNKLQIKNIVGIENIEDTISRLPSDSQNEINRSQQHSDLVQINKQGVSGNTIDKSKNLNNYNEFNEFLPITSIGRTVSTSPQNKIKSPLSKTKNISRLENSGFPNMQQLSNRSSFNRRSVPSNKSRPKFSETYESADKIISKMDLVNTKSLSGYLFPEKNKSPTRSKLQLSTNDQRGIPIENNYTESTTSKVKRRLSFNQRKKYDKSAALARNRSSDLQVHEQMLLSSTFRERSDSADQSKTTKMKKVSNLHHPKLQMSASLSQNFPPQTRLPNLLSFGKDNTTRTASINSSSTSVFSPQIDKKTQKTQSSNYETNSSKLALGNYVIATKSKEKQVLSRCISANQTNSELLNIPRTMSAGHNHSLVSRRMTSARDRDRSDSRNLRTLSAVDGGKVKPILEKSRSSNPGQDRISYAELPIEETLMSSRGMVFSFEFLFLNI